MAQQVAVVQRAQAEVVEEGLRRAEQLRAALASEAASSGPSHGWVLGWGLFLLVTNGAPAVYGRVMFSMHMVEHMALMMAVPILLVPASAITLALRALPARRDRTLGPREVLLAPGGLL